MDPTRPDATKISDSELKAGLRDGYELSIANVERIRTVCAVTTLDGRKYIWKCVRNHPDVLVRLQTQKIISDALRHHGVTVAAPIVNRYGGWVTQIGQDRGYLQTWISGTHMDVRNKEQRLKGTATIAAFHAVTGQLHLYHDPGLYRTPLPEKLRMKRDFLRQVWPAVQKTYPDLDLRTDNMFRLADAAVLTAAHVFQPRYCHRDLAPHNLLLQQDGRMALIDFDESGFDDPLLDLIQCANHGIHQGGLSVGYFCEMVDAYRKNHPLSPERELALWHLFGFPEILFRWAAEWARDDTLKDIPASLQRAIALEETRQSVLSEDLLSYRGHR